MFLARMNDSGARVQVYEISHKELHVGDVLSSDLKKYSLQSVAKPRKPRAWRYEPQKLMGLGRVLSPVMRRCGYAAIDFTSSNAIARLKAAMTGFYPE